ncbi:uncharacterized protein K02A2.6-like [Neodiprion lecontei]|uniref:Uncharacterized protein K02A2.6-like n=1 Tax=Neodiprion lecontei TaxID=441921 RepID=A0A6J0B9T0_NEOLC|nr:uncharacterized protein K02A2.6-like [Neodiprion lecontei]
MQAFTDYFEPKKNVVFERSRFNSRSQLAGETVDQYVTALHVMTEKCNYGQLRDELIRDRIVMGLTDTRTKERLQLKSDLTLDSAVTIARQTEDQRRQVKSLPVAPEVIDIDRVKVVTGGGQPSAPKGRNTDCSRCDLKFHRNNKCPALTSKCRSCGKIGHWDKVCRSKSVNLAQAATSEVTEEEEEETSNVYFLGNVSQSGSNNDFDADAFIVDFQQSRKFHINTGADITCVKYCDVPGPDRKYLDVVGVLLVTIRINSLAKQVRCCIIKNLRKNLFGKDAIKIFNLVRIMGPLQASENSSVHIEQEFPEIFKGLGNFKQEFKIHLKRDTILFSHSVPRSVPIPLLPKLKNELAKMEKDDVIERVKEPTKWCSPIVCIPKGETVRVCGDYTQVNKNLLRPVFPILNVDISLARMRRAKFFSKLDAKSGFYQIKLDRQSQELTTFITPLGRYAFKRLPFGINSAPDLFAEVFLRIFDDMANVIVHMDDILIYGESMEQHDATLREALKRISKEGITLNQSKCIIGVQEVQFLGHLVSAQGIKFLPERVSAIQNSPEPINKTSLTR